MNLQIANKLALVSGSTAGMGYAIAEALAREEARVIMNGRTQESVDDAVSKLKANGDVVGFAGDLSTAEVAERAALTPVFYVVIRALVERRRAPVPSLASTSAAATP